MLRRVRALAICCSVPKSQLPRSFSVAAGLLLHSLFNLETYNLGFDADHVVAVTLSGKAATPALYEQLSDRVNHLPGVKAPGIPRCSRCAASVGN